MYAPRILNEPVRCRFSHLSHTGPPTRSASPRECHSGRVPDDVGEQLGRRLDVGTADQGWLVGGHLGAWTRRDPRQAARTGTPGPRRVNARRTVVEVTDPATAATPSPAPTTLGELRATGAAFRPVKAELRANLLARLGRGEPSLPGMVGFEDTVVPEVERALHRRPRPRPARRARPGQDPADPHARRPARRVDAGPRRQRAQRAPAAPDLACGRTARSPSTATPRRSAGCTAATASARSWPRPDTSVGDLIGDVDPIKVAEGRTLGDPETVHYGLVPRTNRGIFSVNELPDLAERIQVALLNVLEERDIQIRGYRVRLPLDLLLVASANPEDYTNRGRIITPLKDRFGAEVRTHYPLELADEIRLLHQEAQVSWTAPADGTARSTPRSSPSTWPRSSPASPGWSASPATSTSAPASAPGSRSPGWRRSPPPPSAGPRSPGRPGRWPGSSTCPSVVPASRGKVEFADSGADPDDDREVEVLEHLLRQATAQTFRARCAGLDLTGLQEHFTGGETVESGELVPAPGAARPARHHPEAGRAARPARACPRASSRPSRRRPRSSSRSRGCT